MKKLPNRLCTGCMACAAICPKKAITFNVIDGFYKRHVSSNCIRCGLCEAVCPILCPAKKSIPKSVVSAVHKNKTILKSSASGGVFAGIACDFLKKNGRVCGAVMKEKEVLHEINEKEFNIFQGSKYLQSNTENIFSKVEDSLKQGKPTLFSGTPCQVAALYSFVRHKKINEINLFTIELVCHGVPSFSLIRVLEEKYKKQIKRILSFRDKKDGWNSHYAITLEFEDGTIIRDTSCFYKGFSGFKMLRTSCYDCQFKDIARCADLTIGDLWGNKNNLIFKDGLSLVLINTQKGAQMLENSSHEFFFRNIKKEICWLKGNPNLIKHHNPYKYHPFRLLLNWNLKYLSNKIVRAFYCGDFDNMILEKIVHAIDFPYEKLLIYERNKNIKKVLSDFFN